MATFGELWAAILPAALPVAPPDPAHPDREVGWVRVLKARVPAFDALDAGDVAIVPASALAVVAPGPGEIATLVEALATARCAGILLIESDGPDGPDPGLAAATVREGMPVLRAGHVDANQLERSVIGFLLNRRAELEHQAGLLEATLEEVALGSGDVGALIATVAGFLGRAVALEGRRGEVVAVHAPETAPGAAAAVSAYLAGTRTAALRVPLPAPPAASPIDQASPDGGMTPRASTARRAASPGQIVLLGDRPASELERVVGPRVGRLLALELARTEAVRRAQDSARRADVLPPDGPPWVVLMARQGSAGGATSDRASIEAREEIRSRLRVIASPRRLALRGDVESLEVRLVLAVRETAADGVDAGVAARIVGPDVLRLATRVADLLDRPVAVSRPFMDATGRPAAEAEARATLEVAESLVDRPRVARADRLPAYRLLASLQNLVEGPRNARALLEPLMAGSPDARRERLATLRAVLDQPGFNEAAAALGVHRNTLAYRIRRIERLTGWRLSDPELRLPLTVAVRLAEAP